MGNETFVLRGSTLIVEIVEPEELKTKGGIIIATSDNQIKGGSVAQGRLEIGRVLMVGEGYWDEEKKAFIPLDVSIGAIVILPQYSLQIISTFPGINRPTKNKIAMIKADQVLGLYRSPEAFEYAKQELNT